MKSNTGKISVCILLISAFLFSNFTVTAAENMQNNLLDCSGQDVTLESAISYSQYSKKYDKEAHPKKELVINGADFSAKDDTSRIENDYYKSGQPVLITSDSGYAEWTFSVEETGCYSILIDYCPAEGKGSSMVRSLHLDGKLPFDEARNFNFTRAWTDQDRNEDGRFQVDNSGNDIRPTQVEEPSWMSTFLYESSGFVSEPLKFYFTSGTHKLTLKAVQEPMAIRSIRLCQALKLPDADQLREEYASAGYTAASAKPLRLQAELPTLKSDSVIMPVSDRSSPAVEPNDPAEYKLNTIGGLGWNSYGGWITYEFAVKESGLYQIALKTKQNFVIGSSSFRTVEIDGKIPCKEFSAVEFPYSRNWKISLLQDEKGAIPIYLKAGKHTLTLKNTLGSMAELLLECNEILKELNSIYTDILMLTGSVPDVNRDYQFPLTIPETLEQMKQTQQRMTKLYNKLVDQTGTAGQNTQTIVQLNTQLEAMVKNPNRIAEKFTSFQNYIESFGAWIDNAKTQGLNLDYLEIAPVGSELPKTSADVWSYLGYHFQSFIASFFVDYSELSYGEKGHENITVWVGSGATGGRDQAQILKTMVGDTFTPKSDIGVNVKLVSMGALLPATLAGIGPDVALSLGSGDAANYAFRNALVDLSKLEGFQEVASRFDKSAMVPLTFDDTVYGVPETQSFLVMFYRKDILQDLGISKLPRTWDEVLSILPILHKNQMEFALPSATVSIMNMYSLLLFQHGGSLYSEDSTKSLIDNDVSIDAFTELIELYKEYGLSETLNFLNRFRLGTAPIGIDDYTMYNSLSVFAPELRGLWDFTMVPGTLREDGTINRASSGGVTASVILRTSKHQDAAWKFIKWWTDTDAQVMFGKQIESVMGTAARYATANQQALYRMPWTSSEYATLKEQWSSVQGTPEVPGGYFLPRYMNFAFRDVFHNNKITGDVLIEAAKNINAEITQKRKEFNLPTA